MTQEQQILAALKMVEDARKEVAALESMNLDAMLQTGGPRTRGTSSMRKIQHGEVVIRAKGGVLEAGFVLAAPPPELDLSLPRTTTPMRSKHQRTSMFKIWKYRNFKRCGTCGCFDTYKSINLEATKGIDLWCYQCGAQEDDVLKEYEPLPDSKPPQRMCADCGKEIWITRGEKMFPTGEIDSNTQKPDYRCLPCHTLVNAAAKKGVRA